VIFDLSGTFGGDFANATNFAKEIVEKIIPSLINDFGYSGFPNAFRENEVRAGGDEKNGTFIATGYQVEQLQKNKYLFVYAVPTNEVDNYFVHYFYPSKTYSSKFGMKPISTTTLINELLTLTFKKLHRLSANIVVSGKTRANLKATLDYVSIHPYNDLNGRISRFLSHISNFGTKYDLTYAFISDLDLVTDSDLYQNLVDEASAAYTQLSKDMFVEMLRLLRLNQKAVSTDYYKLPSFFGLLNCLRAINARPLQNISSFPPAILEEIRTRNWPKFIDSIAGTNWRLKPSSNFNWKNN